MFLAETWLDEVRLNGLCDTLLLKNFFGVSRITRGGGLAIFWKQDFDLQVVNSSPNFIDTIINCDKDDVWWFISFYGAPGTSRHPESWNLLRGLNTLTFIPWLCAGDFNEITKIDEKLGGWTRPNNQTQDFRDVIDEVGFRDLGYVGSKFTWVKHYSNGPIIWEHLETEPLVQKSGSAYFSLFRWCIWNVGCPTISPSISTLWGF